MWWKVKYRSEDGKLHMHLVEGDNEEEAQMNGEMQLLRELESIERVKEEEFVSPLLSKVKPL